ncbi:hypothetical protein PIB30_012268 [Stylosanthes scabra]|uniref:Uncharacterized protein n=1 Tax=Stylosanthes scabra TaxID=79078 RepID=A0ABU6X3F6_9FABA|nr:hypothetical protein [Stylosanthes scabra]
MGSGIIYYEISRIEKYEDSGERTDSDFAIVKTRRYHFDDEPFIHPLHRVRFDPDRLYELPVESLLALRRRDPSKKKNPSPQGSGWMCEGDDVEGKKVSEEVPERVGDAKDEGEKEEDPEEDAPEEEMPAIPRALDVDADEVYLHYLEELRRHSEYSPIHSSQTFAEHPFDDV